MRLLSTEYGARSGRGVAPSWVVLALVLLALFALLLGKAMGSDATSGHIFSSGETVTADSMNAIVGSAVINSGFYTAKASQSTVADADVLLVYSPSLAGFRQMTWAQLALTNAELVSVLFGTTDTARRSNFLAGADSTAISNFIAGASTPVRSNFFLSAWAKLLPAVTNQATYSPTNAGAFVPWWDNTNNTWAGLQWPVRYTSPAFTWPAGLVTNLAHSLPGTPQQARWVLSCTAANGANFAIGDEIPVESVQAYTTNQVVSGADQFNIATPAFTWGVNSSNVYIRSYTNAALAYNFVINSTGTGNIPITNANFKLKAYATYWP